MVKRRVVIDDGKPDFSLKASTQDTTAEDLFGSALSNMDDKYLKCRDIKHPWRVLRDYHVVDASKDMDVQPRLGHTVFVQRLLVCTRCGKKRSDAYVISTRSRWQGLEKLNSTYSDPPGFSVKGIGRMSGTGEMVRGEAFRRIMAAASD